jgi:hypothetical protein
VNERVRAAQLLSEQASHCADLASLAAPLHEVLGAAELAFELARP